MQQKSGGALTSRTRRASPYESLMTQQLSLAHESLDFAAGLDRVDTERAWAFDHARQLAASDRFAAARSWFSCC